MTRNLYLHNRINYCVPTTKSNFLNVLLAKMNCSKNFEKLLADSIPPNYIARFFTFWKICKCGWGWGLRMRMVFTCSVLLWFPAKLEPIKLPAWTTAGKKCRYSGANEPVEKPYLLDPNLARCDPDLSSSPIPCLKRHIFTSTIFITWQVWLPFPPLSKTLISIYF